MLEKWDFSKIEDQKKFDALPKEEKDEIVGEAKERAEKENIEKEISEFEKELSLEVIEKIMEKVQDIDKEGTAYSCISLGKWTKARLSEEKFADIFKHGLLGGYGRPLKTINKKAWIESLRFMPSDKLVYFNIVGRTLFSNKDGLTSTKEKPVISKIEIANSSWSHNPGFISLLIDISKFKEYGEPSESIDRIHTFKAGRPNAAIKNPVTKKWESDSRFGFILSPRVSPRLFRGIVLNLKAEEDNEYYKSEEIASIMKDCYKEKQNMLLPIYDENGNLLWPKQMSYEEVKKFVEERDKKADQEK